MILRFVVLFSFLAHITEQTKCLLLYYEPCMVRPTLIDMNLVELKHC